MNSSLGNAFLRGHQLRNCDFILLDEVTADLFADKSIEYGRTPPMYRSIAEFTLAMALTMSFTLLIALD